MPENTSGLGKGLEIPVEIRRWSWAAFLGSWIWGVFNGVPLALLALIPLVGIVMPFVLGARGNEMAWQGKRWKSTDHFLWVQRNWIRGILIFYAGMILLGGIVALISINVDFPEETIGSKDGRLAITIPSNWIEAEGGKDSSLGAEGIFDDAALFVEGESRSSVAEFLEVPNLRDYLSLYIEGFRQEKKGQLMGDPVPLNVGGFPALQAEVSTVIDNVRYVHLITAVEAGDLFVLVNGLSLRPDYEVQKPILRKITNSLKVSDATAMPGLPSG